MTTKAEEATAKAAEAEQSAAAIDFNELLSGPAFYSNKMYASNLALGMRISFLEAAEGGAERFRTAVFLTWPDVIALRDLISGQLEKVAFEFLTPVEKPAAAEDDGGPQK